MGLLIQEEVRPKEQPAQSSQKPAQYNESTTKANKKK